jgi:hypothetical protein
LDHCDKAQWRPVNVFCKINSFLKRKYKVCRTSEMTHVFHSYRFEEKRQLWRPRRRRDEEIEMDLQETWCKDVEWVQLAQVRN